MNTEQIYCLLCALLINFPLEIFAAKHNQVHKNSTNTNFVNLEQWQPPAELRKQMPFYLLGFDSENRRVYYIHFGKWNAKRYVEKGGKDFADFKTYRDYIYYKMIHDGKKYSKPGDKFQDEIVVISDWDKFNYEQMSSMPTLMYHLQSMREFQKIQSVLEYGFFINVDAAASAFLRMGKPLMGSMMERIEIYGTQRARWIPRLLRRIPFDQLPEFLGGSKNHTLIAV